MKIKIIAISPNDGWAFLTKEEKSFLLRPPYRSSDLIQVSEKDIENAFQLGFEKNDIDLDNIIEVIKFLKEKYIESKNNQNIDIPSSDQLVELLKYANENILEEYLNKVSKELLPDGKILTAEFIVIELMKLDKVKNNIGMLEMATDILEKCLLRLQEKEKFVMTLSGSEEENLEAKFPNASNKYSANVIIKYQKNISSRGSLFAIPVEVLS